MKKFTLILFTCIAFICAVFTSATVKASHAAGGELIYEWVSDSTYKILFKFYRDCSGISEPTTITVCYDNTCNNTTGSVTLNKLGFLPGGGSNGQEVTTGCPNTYTTCNGGSIPGYREWWYSGNVTLPSRCDHWRFYTGISARNTINNLSGGNLYVEATLNNLYAQGNSSAFFTVPPVPYVCVNSPYTYNNGAVDANNDSLTFEMISPMNGPDPSGGCQFPPATSNLLLATYNLTNNPFATGNTFNLNASTGQMAFTPNTQGYWVVTMRVKEYRNGVLIGTVLRDVQIVAIACNNTQPVISTVLPTISGATFTNGRIEGCSGTPLSFCFDAKSSDTGAVLVVSDNHNASCPGSTISYTGQTTDSVRGCLSWTPGFLDTGLRVFTVTVKDSNCAPPGIIVSQTFVIPIYIWPVTQILKDTTICPGDSVKLLAVGGSTFSWSVLPGGSPLSTLSCTNCKNPTARPTQTTRYVVQSNNVSVCNKNKDTVTITVVVPPSINAGPDTTTCVNNSLPLNIHLNPSPGTTYHVQWTPSTYLSNDTIPTPTVVNPVNDIIYYVSVTPNGLNRCAAKDTLLVKVVKGMDIFNNDTAICAGAVVNINATGDPRYTYLWTPSIGVTNTSVLTTQISPDTSRTYTVKATFPGCRDSVLSLYIDVQPNPVVYVGPDQTLCFGDTLTLKWTTVTPASYPNYTYAWTPGGGLSPTAAEPHPIFTALNTTNLTLTVTTPAGCSGSDNIQLAVVPGDFITVSNDTAICPGDTAQLHATGTAVSLNWTPNNYISNAGSTDPQVWPVASTTYTVIGVDANHCIDTQSVLVTVKPAAVIDLPDSVTIYPGESYQMDPGGNCLYFQWFPPLGLSADNIANPLAQPAVNTRYFINGATEFGCTVSDSMDVIVSLDSYIDMPNAFSPGSNPNSELKPVHRGAVTLNYFRVFNRWGVKMFETSDINKGWNGTYNGQPQPMGVYVYIVEAVTPSGRKFYKQGNITLIR
jgi:gliding motility-associated-like protein